MNDMDVKRKLSAIVSADVKGYSRLMGENEVATVQTITLYRRVMTGLIQRRNGRVVDSPGDNLLAEFASVVDAVECAVIIQKELKARNDELPENRRMAFRRLTPESPLEAWRHRLPYKDEEILERALEGFRKAGLE